MGKICKVTLNNKETFYANCGDLLLDSAITNGVELPHDCRSGICGSCKVRVVDGKLFPALLFEQNVGTAAEDIPERARAYCLQDGIWRTMPPGFRP